MIQSLFRSFWIHLRVRAGACLRSPSAWLMLLVFGLTTALYWPGIPGASNPLEDPGEGPALLLVWFLWFWFWLAPPMVWVRGRATAGKGESPLGVGAAPALPVGPRTRACAEAILVLVVLGTIRWVTLSIFHSSWSIGSVMATIIGAFFWFPMAVAWALPVRNPATFMMRPAVIAGLATVSHGVGGFFATWLGLVVGGLVLTALTLLTAGFEVPELRGFNRSRRPSDRFRNGMDPERQLVRDSMIPVLSVWGPWVLVAVVVYGTSLLLDVRGVSWEWILFGGFEAFLIITLQPLFRPFNSNLLAESLVGKHGATRGSFMRAWSVLPVGRESVLRKVWIHAAVAGLILWIVPVTVLVVRYRLVEGLWRFGDSIGGLMEFVVVGALLIPVMAGLMVAVALGKRLEYVLSGLCLLMGVHALFLVKLLLREVLGPGNAVAEIGPVVLLIVLVAIGALPPLRFLHRVPEPQ